MNFEKALSLYKNDKTLQILRAEHFPLLISFFHLAFKQQNRIQYSQPELLSLLGDYIYSLQQRQISDYPKDPLDYLQQWSTNGYLRRYYDAGDDPVYELTPATENALKWLDDLGKQEFVGTESRLLHLFSILKELVSKTNANQYERIKELEKQRRQLDKEIEKAKAGIYERLDDTKIKERYLYAEETARRLLADFRQVEQNFRELDKQARQTIIKSTLTKGKLLGDIFDRQDYMWTTDQGKSFRAFWEFLMSRDMQEELEILIEKIDDLPAVRQLKEDSTIERIKTNLVEAGDKVNRTNDGLIEQLRKFVEQKSLAESRRILQSIENIERHLLEVKDRIDTNAPLLEIRQLFKPSFLMERPLFRPPAKISFPGTIPEAGKAGGNIDILFEQFYIDIELLEDRIQGMLKNKSQVSLMDVIMQYNISKGVAEVLGYMQIAARSSKHHIKDELTEEIQIENVAAGEHYTLEVPLVIYNR